MRLRWPWLLAPLSMAAGCGLLAEADVSALPQVETGIDALDVSDAPDATDAPDGPDAGTSDADPRDADPRDGDNMDALDATDAPDATDAVDVVDALDAQDGGDAAAVLDTSDAAAVLDASDAADALDASDAADALGASDAVDALDASDAADVLDTSDAADARDVADMDLLPACPAARLVAPITNSVATGPRLRFSWRTAPPVVRYRVAVCRRRECEGGDVVWTSDVTGPTFMATVSANVTATDAPRFPPGVYWWKVEALDAGCRPTSSELWEFRVGVTPAPPAGMTVPPEANWWGAYADFNGDGYADLAAGAPTASLLPGATGQVHVRLGDSSAILRSPGSLLTSSQRRFGAHVASAGDVNGDGFGDLLVTSDESLQTFPGRAVGVLAAGVPWSNFPAGASEVRAVGVGDVNGDGFGDVVMSAVVGGAERVYYGQGAPAGASLTEIRPLLDVGMARPCDHFGASVAPAGDLNGDRFADFVIGCPVRLPGDLILSAAGARAFLVFGGETFSAAAPVFVPIRPPETTRGTFGHLVANLGDVQGVGRSVVAVADAQEGTRFLLYAVPPGPASAALVPVGVPIPAGFGTGPNRPLAALVGVGDVNRDGRGDFAIAADDLLFPVITLGVSGQASSSSRPTLSDTLIALAGAGDFNGDGLDDLAVGVRLPLGGALLSAVVQVTTGRTTFPTSLTPDSDATVFRDPDGRPLYATTLAAGR